MKLKIIFFPLILIAVIVFSITHIFPEIVAIKKTTTETEKNTKNLTLRKEKRDIITSLDQDLGKNEEKEKWMNSYLAKNKNEDGIINTVNSLAISSSVSLVDISIEAKEETKKENSKSAASKNILNSSAVDIAENADLVSDIVEAEIPVDLKKMPLQITVAGKYENIKGFLSELNNIDLMSSISGISISSQKSNDEAETISTILSADVEMVFYYLEEMSVNAQEGYGLSFLTSKQFDFHQIEKIKQSIKRDAPDLNSGKKGRSNPFLK